MKRFLTNLLMVTWSVLTTSIAWAQGVKVLNGGANGKPVAAWEAAKRLREAQVALQAAFFEKMANADYASVQSSKQWQAYREAANQLQGVTLDELKSVNEKTAFWINVYNALVTDGIVSLKVRGSVLKSPGFFQRVAYRIGGQTYTPDIIEHGILRGNRKPATGGDVLLKPNDPRLKYALDTADPRIHFALNCGARSCPPIRSYEADKLDAQLDTATRNFINGGDVKIESARNRVTLSPLFQWYAPDFGAGKKELLAFVAKYLADAESQTYLALNGSRASIAYAKYDWSLENKGSE